jgi:hypothetical protein
MSAIHCLQYSLLLCLIKLTPACSLLPHPPFASSIDASVENIKVQKCTFEVDIAGARRYLAVRACALSSELVRFDTLVWDDRDTIRDYLSKQQKDK